MQIWAHKEEILKYIDYENIIDIFQLILFWIHYGNDPNGHEVLPLKGRIDYDENDPNGQNEVFVSDMILHILLITIACFKMLAYMNVIPFVGKLNMFMRDCIFEMG